MKNYIKEHQTLPIINILQRTFYFLPIIIGNAIKRRKELIPIYLNRNNNSYKDIKGDNNQKEVFYMALRETPFSGGLSDRLRGIISVYSICKQKHYPFRIFFEPFKLEDYLKPNKYDWRIKKGETCWNFKEVYPCVILTYHKNQSNKYQKFVQRLLLDHYISKPYKQIHVYTNMICKDNEYRELFNELFSPVAELKELINFHLKKLGGKEKYISCTLRFRQLLNDFKEGGQILPTEERGEYIKKCINTIKRLHDLYPKEMMLVTSDSYTFLTNLKKENLSYIYIMPGKVVHLAATFDAEKKTYMKSFLDMYMVSYAKTVFQIRDKMLMNSSFPYRAALLGGRPYKEFWTE